MKHEVISRSISCSTMYSPTIYCSTSINHIVWWYLLLYRVYYNLVFIYILGEKWPIKYYFDVSYVIPYLSNLIVEIKYTIIILSMLPKSTDNYLGICNIKKFSKGYILVSYNALTEDFDKVQVFEIKFLQLS